MACVVNNGGILKTILSSRGLVPFSRLTYCAFLTNGFVELYMAGSLRQPLYMGTINLVRFDRFLILTWYLMLTHILLQMGQSFAHVALTFLAALILCLIFESPIHGIEKIILRRDTGKKLGSSEELNDKAHLPSRNSNSSTSNSSL
jgi:hypothetical protein